MALSREAEYTKKLDALVREAKTPGPEAEKRIKELLVDMSREVSADIARTDPSSYSSARLKSLRESIDRAIREFGAQATSVIQRTQGSVYQQATASIDSVVSAATGGITVHAVVDRAALTMAQGYTADLVSGLTHDASTRINSAIQRAYMGGASLPQLMGQVGSVLKTSASGSMGVIERRALDISTNEIMRVHSMASTARIGDLAERHPELQKEWIHIPAAMVPRLSHLMAHGQVRKPDESFEVGGEDLMYPRDPAGSAANTINCHCIVRPHFPLSYLKSVLAQ